MKTETKEMEGEAKKIIEIIFKHSPLANAEYSTYSGSWVVDAMIDYANSLRSEIKNLQQWKKEEILIWSPTYEYMQKHPDVKVGASITKTILEFLKERDQLKAELQRVKNDLDDALDVKNGKGPTALSRLSNELRKAKDKIEFLEQRIADLLHSRKDSAPF